MADTSDTSHTFTITCCETPKVGLDLHQRYFATCGIFEFVREEALRRLFEALNGNPTQEQMDEDERTLDLLRLLTQNCHHAFAAMMDKDNGDKDAPLMLRYAQQGLILAQWRWDCYQAGLQKAEMLAQQAKLDKGARSAEAAAIDPQAIANNAWLESGAVRQHSVTLVDNLLEVELQVIGRGYRTITIDEWDETAKGRYLLPNLINGKLFRKRAPGEKVVRNALELKKSHPRLNVRVGKKHR